MISRRSAFRKLLPALMLLVICGSLSARTRKRIEPAIPDIPGYLTLKCDFHMHTVFSDGEVWPTVRVEEAWRDGLDAFAITDHIEYTPHKGDLPNHPGRAWEIAAPEARELGLILIRGVEITRDLPVGHYNALFVTDEKSLDRKDYREAVGEAIKQGAFIWWNHPPYKQEKADTFWHEPQDVLLEKGWMHGIELVNENDYCPQSHRWCIEHHLTMLGNTDIHDPIGMAYDTEQGDLRSMTLVFARERSLEGIREALFAHRTAVLSRDTLYGVEEQLGPLFRASVELVNPELSLKGKGSALLQVRNRSDIPFHLAATDSLAGLRFPAHVTLEPRAVVLVAISSADSSRSGTERIELPYAVQNVHPAPGELLAAPLAVTMHFEPPDGN